MASSQAAPLEDTSAGPASAVLFAVQMLTARSQFIAASRGFRRGTKGLNLQGRPRGDDSPHIGVGFTCSKKVGNAVARNRAKRRLREVARALLPLHGRPGWDYVLVGRPEMTDTRPFEDLKADLTYALAKVHTQA